MVGLRIQFTERLLLIAVIIVILSGSVIFSVTWPRAVYPRQLQVGDRWTYSVVFPDAKGYALTETVQSKSVLNGTETYIIFMDDDQHISTSYLWLTSDWREVRVVKPYIGNLNASSMTTYAPPLQLVQIPLRVGDKWEVNSSVTTLILINNSSQTTVSAVREERETGGMEQIKTPAGTFQTFKISVLSSNSPFETLWFSTDLGQVVHAEYCNSLGEVVTEPLTGYALGGSNLGSKANLLGSVTTDHSVCCECNASYMYVKLGSLCRVENLL